MRTNPGGGHVADEKRTSPARPRTPRRLSLRYQVVLGVGSLLALLVTAMLVAIALVVAVKADERHGDDRALPYASAVATAALNAKGVANDQRGFLLTGDPTFIHEADRRISDARAAFAAAIDAAADPAQRRAVDDARSGFERWVQTMQGEFATFQAGDRHSAIATSLGPDRALRKTYEQSLANARALSAHSTESATSPAAAASSRWAWILVACLLAALVIGVGVAFRNDLP
jgi:methyl-accepting chemotaxis protein